MNITSEELLNLHYGYVPNKSACIFGLVMFCILAITQLAQGIYYKQWWFATMFISGLMLQAIGYGARYGSIVNPSQFSYFCIQVSCLTISPAFFVAGIYYQLAKLVTVYGQEFSQLRPKTYTCLLIACDFIAILIQTIAACVALSNPSTMGETGRYIMVAGLALQILTMLIFIVLFIGVAIQIYRSSPTNYDLDWYEVRRKPFFDLFIPALMASTLLIFSRSVYRLIEGSHEWKDLNPPERYQLSFDGLLVLIACLILTIVHPGVCLGREQIPIDTPREEKFSDFIDE